MAYTYNNGIRIYYEVEGEGPPLLLHHGPSVTLDSWRDAGYVRALKHDYRLILMDARGHGASAKPHDPEAYAPEQRVGDILAVLDSLNIGKVHYMGYSLGGWLGFGLASLAPHRIHSLILGGAHPYAESMAFYRIGLSDGNEAWVSLLEKASGPLPSPTKVRLLRNDARALQMSVANDHSDVSGVLQRMTMPVLLYAGEHDPRHALAQKAAARLSQARLLTVPGADHFQTHFRTDVILPAVRSFLRNHAREAAPQHGVYAQPF